MCGRYCTPDEKEIRPGDLSTVYTKHGEEIMRWGVPLSTKRLVINARSETAMDKPMFRQAMLSGRCIIEAASFFEWDESKRCHAFSSPAREKLYLAALYTLADDGQKRFAVLTQEAAGDAQKVHPRMPCFLPTPEYRKLWLQNDELAPALLQEKTPLIIERIHKEAEQLSLFSDEMQKANLP